MIHFQSLLCICYEHTSLWLEGVNNIFDPKGIGLGFFALDCEQEHLRNLEQLPSLKSSYLGEK